MNRLDRALTRLEVAVVSTALLLLAALLLTWVGLKGLSSRTTPDFVAGLLFRALVSGVTLGALGWRLSRSKGRTALFLVAGLFGGWLWVDVGVEWGANLVGWLQDGSVLTWFGGVRGVGTRLTLVVAMAGGALATASGRHVSIDLATRAFSERVRGVVLRGGAVLSALVCLFAAWGFFDFTAIDAFGAPSDAAATAKLSVTAQGLGRHARLALKQARLDLTMLPKVLAGHPWDRALSAADWNAWLGDDAELAALHEADATATRTPLLALPGESPRGLLVKDLSLLIPLGLLWLALRFLLWGLLGAKVESDHAAPASLTTRARRLIGAAVASVSGLFALFGGWPAALVALLALVGLPLFIVMAGSAELAWTLAGAPLNRLAPRVLDEQFAGSPVLVTIPLFTALGYVLAESKAPERIVEASRALFGWLPGGLALVCLAASAFFTSLTGGSGVTIIAIGGLLYPTLRAQKYDERFSLGLVTTGGSLGLLLPPSLPILVYALVAGLEFTAAFKAGLLPAVLVLVVLGLYSAWVGVRDGVPREPFEPKKALAALSLIKWELGIPVVILGSLGTSLATLDESAGLALLYTLFCALFVHRDLDRRALPRVLQQALALSGAVILILMMANALMNFVIDRQVPAHVLERLLSLGLSERWQFLVVLNVFLLVIGMVMDGFSALIVAVPLVLPFAARFGLHPFHLAMMVLLNLELAFCMPPLGLNLFIASFRFQRPVVSLYRSVLPFVGLLTLCLALVMAVPWLSTALVQPDIDAARLKAKQLGVAPREAWNLECVQEDSLNPKPCTEAERLEWAPPDAGTDDADLEEDLLEEMMQ